MLPHRILVISRIFWYKPLKISTATFIENCNIMKYYNNTKWFSVTVIFLNIFLMKKNHKNNIYFKYTFLKYNIYIIC